MIDFDKLVAKPCLKTFGQIALYKPQGRDAFNINGIFDAAHTVIESDGLAEYSTTRPMFDVSLADFPATVEPVQGDLIEISGANYKVVDIQPDGVGMVKLLLNRRHV
ncbi:MAG: hypothetical protein GY795_43100 [Desulfobacterales bacterium]|nr:hypothetical protein [Desulfobacterales bacterium]